MFEKDGDVERTDWECFEKEQRNLASQPQSQQRIGRSKRIVPKIHRRDQY